MSPSFPTPKLSEQEIFVTIQRGEEIENKKHGDELITPTKLVICSKIFKLGFQLTVFINYDLSGCICLTFLIFINQEIKKEI